MTLSNLSYGLFMLQSKFILGLDGVELIGSDGGDEVDEGVDGGTVLGEIEGREGLDVPDDGFGHVPRIEEYLVGQQSSRCGVVLFCQSWSFGEQYW
jgi:hypothetical protein